jgi:phosphoesterase RecJ-like protein
MTGSTITEVCFLGRLEEWLKGKEKIALAGHVRPDGDCVGSTTALYQYLQNNYPEKKVDLYLEEIPEPMKFIKATATILHEISAEVETGAEVYDIAIALDCGDANRVGFAKPVFTNARTTACIDHHVSNDNFGDVNYIKTNASSTSELVFELLEEDENQNCHADVCNETYHVNKITKAIAESLYMGIVHDTGVFQYSCATPHTFRIAAKLLETGIDATKIINDTFFEKTYVQNLLMGYGLLNAKLHFGGKVISSIITKAVLEEYGADKNDIEGVVANIRKVKGVEVAIFLYETEVPSEVKVSLRAKEYANVNEVAMKFAGGGHVKAAGCTVVGDPDVVLSKVLVEMEKIL